MATSIQIFSPTSVVSSVPSSYEVSIFKLEMFINKREGRASLREYHCYFSVDLLKSLGVFLFNGSKVGRNVGKTKAHGST